MAAKRRQERDEADEVALRFGAGPRKEARELRANRRDLHATFDRDLFQQILPRHMGIVARNFTQERDDEAPGAWISEMVGPAVSTVTLVPSGTRL